MQLFKDDRFFSSSVLSLIYYFIGMVSITLLIGVAFVMLAMFYAFFFGDKTYPIKSDDLPGYFVFILIIGVVGFIIGVIGYLSKKLEDESVSETAFDYFFDKSEDEPLKHWCLTLPLLKCFVVEGVILFGTYALLLRGDTADYGTAMTVFLTSCSPGIVFVSSVFFGALVNAFFSTLKYRCICSYLKVPSLDVDNSHFYYDTRHIAGREIIEGVGVEEINSDKRKGVFLGVRYKEKDKIREYHSSDCVYEYVCTKCKRKGWRKKRKYRSYTRDRYED